MAKFAVFLVAKILKCTFFDLFERLHPPNNFKTKKQALGALPQTPLSLARPQGAGGKPYPPTPTVSVESIQGVKGKNATSSPLTPLHLRGVAKLTEADGLETCQGLRSNRVASWPLQVGGDNALW